MPRDQSNRPQALKRPLRLELAPRSFDLFDRAPPNNKNLRSNMFLTYFRFPCIVYYYRILLLYQKRSRSFLDVLLLGVPIQWCPRKRSGVMNSREY